MICMALVNVEMIAKAYLGVDMQRIGAGTSWLLGFDFRTSRFHGRQTRDKCLRAVLMSTGVHWTAAERQHLFLLVHWSPCHRDGHCQDMTLGNAYGVGKYD